MLPIAKRTDWQTQLPPIVQSHRIEIDMGPIGWKAVRRMDILPEFVRLHVRDLSLSIIFRTMIDSVYSQGLLH